MTRLLTALAVSTALATPLAHAQDITLETPAQKYSYAIGMQMGGSLLEGQVPDVDVDALTQAIRDVMAGAEPKMTEEEVVASMTELQSAMQAAAVAAAGKALADGQAFLTENKGKEGITTTESGLQYRVEKAGEGDSPSAEDQVKVHYEGKLLDGTVFDSSYARGEPAQFGVGQVIPGWTEALQLMAPGAVWEVWLPSEIAYGARGAGGDIGPNEVLNFKIELIEVMKPG